jgi:hypothetical protein
MEAPKLGELITDGTHSRDAVHVAIAPVRAACDLLPGDKIRLAKGSTELACWCAGDDPDAIGVVDPFLRAPVKTGEWFYLCLFPNTVTSLRHVWRSAFFDKVNEDVMKKVLGVQA